MRVRTAVTGVLGLTALSLTTVVGTAVGAGAAAAATPTPVVQQVSTDTLPAFKPTPKTTSQHATEVETDTFSWGSTVVAAFQVGRNAPSYGAQAIGWATSTDAGASWQHGILPGLTSSSPSPNPAYPAAVNQSVAYSAATGTWIVPSVTYVALSDGSLQEKALLVNTSPDGLSWTTATTAVANDVDKAWTSCDNSPTSPHYGACYVAYSQLASNNTLAFVTTTDGGQTWSAPVTMPGSYRGYNTNVVVRPSGTVVVVATDLKNGANGSKLFSTTSADGGATWSAAHPLATIKYHKPAGGIRALNKPTVDVDASGTIWAAWGDCRFRPSCGRDDLVYATSADGVTWSAPVRIPLDAVGSAAERFIPGFAVQPGTSGGSAVLGVVSYTYPNGACSGASCLIDAQYATSADGGATWSAPYPIDSTPMIPGWLPTSPLGRTTGDYLSVSFCGGTAVTVVALATGAPVKSVYRQSQWAATFPPGWAG